MDNSEILAKLSLKEKAFLSTGMSPWEVAAIPQAGLSSMIMIDGPHGLRKPSDLKELGTGENQRAICFPPAVSTACTFNVDLIYSMGEYLAEEMKSMGVRILLGPGANIKRSPLCGRNFEYFSEDPLLSGKIASAFIRGIQDHGLGTSLKHFVANNQETRRMTISAKIDERTLREIYLASFEEAIVQAKPWTIMAAYNRINGKFACHHPYLLKSILREEWGYEGVVLSDWGAVDLLPDAIKHGLNLEMPSSGTSGPDAVIQAVEHGSLSMQDLDTSVNHLIGLLKKGNDAPTAGPYDQEAHHLKAKEIAKECVVLLENRENTLPIPYGLTIALIGELAVRPRIQGGGSSKINPYRIDTIKQEFEKVEGLEMTYVQGYHWDHDETDEHLTQEAVKACQSSDISVVLIGLPDRYETEGMDRTHLNMPPNQVALVDELIDISGKVVIVITSGSVVKIPFADNVQAIIYAGLLGEAGAGAIVETLIGENNPNGKLAETFIKTEEDDPSYGNYPGSEQEVIYREGVFVGYRYHGKFGTDVLYPFGHGLSYTTFDYGDLSLSSEHIDVDQELQVSLPITNTGKLRGKEVVQLYVSEIDPEVDRPPKELKAFKKIDLRGGETKTIEFVLGKRSFAYYHVGMRDWHVKSGKFELLVGSSSQDIRSSAQVIITNPKKSEGNPSEVVYIDEMPLPSMEYFHRNSRIGLLKSHEIGNAVYDFVCEVLPFDLDSKENEEEGIFITAALQELVDNAPLRNIISFTDGNAMTESNLDLLISYLNGEKRETIPDFRSLFNH